MPVSLTLLPPGGLKGLKCLKDILSLSVYPYTYCICPSVYPILINKMSQKCLEEITSNLAQMSTWTQLTLFAKLAKAVPYFELLLHISTAKDLVLSKENWFQSGRVVT